MTNQKPIPVIIDCDPGCDDAAALLLAFRSPLLDIRGITTVAGNVELCHTTPNALNLLHAIGTSVPVSAGAQGPMFRPLTTAANIHGADGLHGIVLPPSPAAVTGRHAWDVIYDEAVAQQGALEIIAVGPLTNLAIALAKYPTLPSLLHRIVIMGGSATCGNTTPAAEFNIYVDPEAADMVFKSGVPLYMCGLDVTHKAYLTAAEIEEIAALGSPQAQLFAQITRGSLVKEHPFCPQGVPMHDPAAVLFATDPTLFEAHHCWIRVETKGEITRGKTVTDYYSDSQHEPNAWLVLDVNRPQFVAAILSLLSRY